MQLKTLTKEYLANHSYKVNTFKQIISPDGKIVEKISIISDLSTRPEFGQVTFNELNAVMGTVLQELSSATTAVNRTPLQKMGIYLHNNHMFQFPSDNRKLYYTQEYEAGYFGLSHEQYEQEHNHIDRQIADDALSTTLPDYYCRKDKAGRVTVDKSALASKRIFVVPRFSPWQPAYFEAGFHSYANLWKPPHWWRMANGERFKGETPIISKNPSVLPTFEALLQHVLVTDYQVNVVKSWLAVCLQGKVNQKVLCLSSHAGGVGKSLITEYLFRALLGRANVMGSEVRDLHDNPFKVGVLAKKTGLILPEVRVSPKETSFLKNFISNSEQDCEVKYVQGKGDTKKYCNIVANSNIDLNEPIFPPENVALLRRFIIPKVAEEPIEGSEIRLPKGGVHVFTRDDIMRIVGMGEEKDTQSLADTEEIASHLLEFARSPDFIDPFSPEVAGYLDPEDKHENYVESLVGWKKDILRTCADYLRASPKFTVKNRQHYYMLEGEDLTKLHLILCDDMAFMMKYEEKVKRPFSKRALCVLFKDNKDFFNTYTDGKKRRYDGLINKFLFDLYLRNEGLPPICPPPPPYQYIPPETTNSPTSTSSSSPIVETPNLSVQSSTSEGVHESDIGSGIMHTEDSS